MVATFLVRRGRLPVPPDGGPSPSPSPSRAMGMGDESSASATSPAARPVLAMVGLCSMASPKAVDLSSCQHSSRGHHDLFFCRRVGSHSSHLISISGISGGGNRQNSGTTRAHDASLLAPLLPISNFRHILCHPLLSYRIVSGHCSVLSKGVLVPCTAQGLTTVVVVVVLVFS